MKLFNYIADLLHCGFRPYSKKAYKILSDPLKKKELIKAIDIERGHLPVDTPCEYVVERVGE